MKMFGRRNEMITLLATQPMMDAMPNTLVSMTSWGEVSIIAETQEHGGVVVSGHHIAVEGNEKVIRDWLRPFSPVWVGVGTPLLQEFERLDVQEEV
jgi:hypothetical protein